MAGEEDQDLAEQERQAAEDRAYEQNPYGTGVDPDLDQGYDYEASPEATDVDYMPGDNGLSDEFTNHGGTDLYANQFGNDDEDDQDDDSDGQDGGDDGDDEVQQEAQEWQEDWDGVEEEDDDAQPRQGDDGNQVPQRGQRQGGQRTQAKGKDTGKIKWKPGQAITAKLLRQVWSKIKSISQLKPLVEAANKAVALAISESGPKLTLRFAAYAKTVSDANESNDLIGTILELGNQLGKRSLYTALSAVEAMFLTKDFTQVSMIASMQDSLIDTMLKLPPVAAKLQPIFTIAVPLINQMGKNK